MSCSHPLKGFILGINPDTGKKILKVTRYNTDHVELRNGKWIPCQDPPTITDKWHADRIVTEYEEFGCGHCPACQLKRARDWAVRLMLEHKYHDASKCWFLTLTYDEEHYQELCTTALNDIGTLYPRDMQLFWKRLRSALNRKYRRRAKTKGRKYIDPPLPPIRFFECGEYGTSTLRCHFHAIVFELPLDDAVYFGVSHTGNPMFTSNWLTDVWGKGYVMVAPVTFETCAYVARYMQKKLIDKSDLYIQYGVYPEFVNMSRRPGIAADYYNERAPAIYENDEIIINGQSYKPPPFFDSKYELEDPEDMERIKQIRKEYAMNQKENMLRMTNKPYLKILEDQERQMKKKVKLLQRSQI